MKPILIIVVAVIAVIVAIVIGKNVISNFREDYEITGDSTTSLAAKTEDIEKLNKDIRKRQETAYEERGRRSDYEQLDQNSIDTRMGVADFREEPNDSTLRAATGMPSAASKWQTWLYLAFIALGGWIVFSRLRSKR